MIRTLLKLQIGERIRSDGPQHHSSKSGTPTMGGLLILATFIGSTLLWADLSNHYIWLVLLSAIGFGAIGLWDDFLKLRKGDGITAKEKIVLQIILSLAIGVYLLYFDPTRAEYATRLSIPFFKSYQPDLGFGYLTFIVFIIVGTSNAVNLTDGLDGLAILPTVLVSGALGIIAYLTGNYQFANYLHIPFISGAGELLIITGALCGAGLGFLWFNTYPAMVFMGDIGALALGAALGVIAVIVRQEIVLAIMGGVFVVETLSVILQVASFKLTGKRIFRMAPLHHHYELKGWPEPRVIVRFWIITVVLVLVGLATLKLR